MSLKKSYTYDDVCLEPVFDNIGSRVDKSIDLSTWLTTKTRINIPLLAANMDTVISDPLADILISKGSIPFFHRFTTEKQLKTWAKKYNRNCYISIGANIKDNLLKYYQKIGIKGVVIDVANSHSYKIMKLAEHIRKKFPKLELIIGNVCTSGGYIDMCNCGAQAVKVGIGSGSICVTRLVTGFGIGMFTAIQECAEQSKKYSVPIIADGSIRTGGDIVKALAAGATTVMCGKLFSSTLESAAKKYVLKNGVYIELKEKDYNTKEQIYYHIRGQASKNFQDDFKGGLKEGTVAEGVDFKAPMNLVCGNTLVKRNITSKELITYLLGSLRSGMTYGGARTIGELQRKAVFRVNTSNYLTESKPRPE